MASRKGSADDNSNQGESTESEFNTFVTRKTNEGNPVTIPLPSEVRERVSVWQGNNEVVHWNYDTEWGHIVLCNHTLHGDCFRQMGQSKIYDNSYIRPPNNGVLPLRELIEPHDTVAFVAHPKMGGGDVSSTYLFWGGDHVDVLGNQELRENLLQVPRFLG